MAIETVQAVRQAEINAAETEKEAIKRRDAILSKAQEEAKTVEIKITKAALDKADADLKQAGQQGDLLMKAAVQKAEKEVSLLKEMVKCKEQSAIDLILSEVI